MVYEENRKSAGDSGKIGSDIVKYLRAQGDTYKEIGDKIGIGESFISLIKDGKRRLTTEHLCAIETVYSISIPELILLARQPENIPNSHRARYRTLRSKL